RCYCHFTAPIRRYPDLVVHRILKESLKPGGLSEKRLAQLQSRLPAIADHASERERAALEAERADEDIKKAEYMKNELGQVYPGIINGVTGFGLFVELENTVEGMIPLSELADDYYVYQERLASVIGERTRKTYRLGDPIKIKVIRVDTAAGKITFGLAEG
ncbi:MAG: S1 RNA-binding domain-containing protein, partial [Firmicutes bacterium]|nr:S1 RNA-binding domain-containing protein [Bacillota bacterium]